jgi:1,4-alpha-glucan branching enzyme
MKRTKTIHKSTKTGHPKETSRKHPVKKMRFKIKQPKAKSVALVGSFTEWETRPIPLSQSEPGLWEAEVELPSGRHEYLFLTDEGEWLQDPNSTEWRPNPWGGLNSVIDVDLLTFSPP